MSTLEIVVRILGGVVLTLANAFFVVAEFALTRLRQLDGSEFQDHPSLRRAWKMTDKLEFYLTGCQLGISSTSVLLGIVAEPAVTASIKPLMQLLQVPDRAVPAVSIVVSVVIINLVHKIWGEQAPTYLGVERPKQVAQFTALPLYWWCKIAYPAIYAGDGLAKATLRLIGVEMTRSWTQEGGTSESAGSDPGEEQSYRGLRRQMGEVLARGGLPDDRQREVIKALEIDEIPVRDIMVPRKEMIAPSIHKSTRENLRIMSHERRFSRFPLVGDQPEDFLGIVYVPDLFRNYDRLRRGEVQLIDLATPPLKVPADLPVSKLIDRFQEENQELALVESEGKIVGLVTITEAFETIAGQVDDPFDLPAATP